MPISVQCDCGKRLSAKEETAGKRGRCPGCGNIFTIPTLVPAAPEPDIYDIIDPPPMPQISRRSRLDQISDAAREALPNKDDFSNYDQEPPVCPSCQRVYNPGTKICVGCGINILTSKPIVMRAHVDENVLYENAVVVSRFLSWLLPIGLFPIASDAYGSFKPSAIKIITLITTAISVAFWIMDASSDAPMGASTNFVLWSGSEPNLLLMLERIPPGEFHYYQLLTNAFLHGGIMHLAGNLVFLLVFGNRVNALLGQWKSVTAYLVLAILASAVFYISEMGKPMVPALGASGAIMGMAGMYFVLMPTSRVYMVFWIRLGIFTGFRRFTKIFSLRGFWVLLFYIAFDIAPAIMHHQDGTAHWAHLGGFASGMTIALGLLVFRGVDAGGGDILTILLGKRAWHLLGKPVDRMLQKIA